MTPLQIPALGRQRTRQYSEAEHPKGSSPGREVGPDAQFPDRQAERPEWCKDAGMSQSDHIIATLWRRALALTGDRHTAEWVVGAALGACSDPMKTPAYKRDRLVTQRAREAYRRARNPDKPAQPEAGSGLALKEQAEQLWTASRRLPRLQMEAWTLRVLEGLDEIPAARALDCSRTAMVTALEQAEQSLRALVGDAYVSAVEAIRNALAQADAGPSAAAIVERSRRARKQRKLLSLAQFILFLLCAALLTWVGWDLIKSDEREDPLRGMREQYSAPMPRSAEPNPPQEQSP